MFIYIGDSAIGLVFKTSALFFVRTVVDELYSDREILSVGLIGRSILIT